MTAQDRAAVKIAGLDGGGDDYLVKPVDLDELAGPHPRPGAATRQSLQRHDFGRLPLAARSRRAHGDAGRAFRRADSQGVQDNVALDAQGRSFREQRRDLETMLYDDDEACESNTVEVSVSALRRKPGRESILTTRGLGYMIAR